MVIRSGTLKRTSIHYVSILGSIFASLIVLIGSLWAFQRGANDFSVFYEAWTLVRSGRGADIYHATPDRFLYAPGFAWLFSPLSFFSRNSALAIWCFLKIGTLVFLVRSFSKQVKKQKSILTLGLGSWGVVFLARPLLIDLQYGQVNTFILGACAWGLLTHLKKTQANFWDGVSWIVLAIAAWTKLFPLPLLCIPFVMTRGVSTSRLGWERAGVGVGSLLIGLVPILTEGVQGTWKLYYHWKDALISRGLPLETHNQSFSAFLHHNFSGNPIHVIARGIEHPVFMGARWLNHHQISTLSLAWSLILGGILMGWIVRGVVKSSLRWIAIVIALLILPSHLVWKPYFIMGLPAVIFAASSRALFGAAGILLFLLENFSGFNWIGDEWGARLEGGAILLWVHLLLIGIVAWSSARSSLSEETRLIS